MSRPLEDPNYEWKVRIDLRCGVDMPLNPMKPHQMPSMICEFAWSDSVYPDSIVPETTLTSFAIEDNRHPIWNQ